MSEADLHRMLTLATFALAGAVFWILGKTTAPYGRHQRSGWGPSMPVRLGWVLMEAPSVFLFAWVFFAGPRSHQLVPLLLLGLWQLHYVHRTLIYPMTMRGTTGKRMALAVVLSGFSFNVLNSYLNARSLTAFGPEYELRWLWSFRFLYGLMLFFTGFVINRWADWTLRRLRGSGETGYKIPRGGLFDEVSCPNYLGELIQWVGWAIMTWSQAGLAFAVFTAANLIPRAVANHNWYRSKFEDYPTRRRAIIPYLL